MSESKLPSDIDRIVGQRVRWRRRELKLTQEKLGDLLGLTFQQVQKYEKGVNRISAGRLFEVGKVLGVPIAYFFDGAEDMLAPVALGVEETAEAAPAPVMSPETLDLVLAFEKIEDPALRKSLLSTIKAAAATFEANAAE